VEPGPAFGRDALNGNVDSPPDVCPSCRAPLPAGGTCRDLFHELSAYTLATGDARFIHQHAVDAYAVQHAAGNPKLATAAGLIGLYLFAEKGWTGRQAQRAHMELGNRMKEWPSFVPPPPAAVTVATVLAAAPGDPRDRAIEEWARAVWASWTREHARVGALLEGPYRLRGR
jgi:hypothetical protein